MRERVKLYFTYSIIVAVLAIASYFVIGVGFTELTTTMISVAAFLYGILGGFSITILWNRFSKTREDLNKETAAIRNVWSMSKVFGPKLMNRLAEAIDKYIIATLDNKLSDYIKSEGQFQKIRDVIQGWKVGGNKEEGTYEDILSNLDSAEASRNSVAYLAQSSLLSYLSASVYVLSGMLVFLMFYTKSGETLSSLLTFAVSSVVALTMVIIRDLNMLRLWEHTLFEVEVGEIFDMIGRLRYYGKSVIDEGRWLPKQGEHYRTRASGDGLIVEKVWPSS